MRVAVRRLFVMLLALGGVAASAGVSAEASEIEADPILVSTAHWSEAPADAMLLAAPSLDENPFAVLVRFDPTATGSDVEALLAGIDGRVVAEFDGDRIHLVETLAGVDRAIAHLVSSPLVLSAEPDAVVRSDALTNDTFIGLQWGLEAAPGIDIEDAWTDAAGASTVVVGVIDSGIQVTHPDLAARMWTNPGEIPGNLIDDDSNGYIDDVNGWDWVDDDNDPDDEHGHGTHVAGTIAAIQNNSTGVAGVAEHVEIVALRFLNADGDGYTSDAIAALDYAIDMGIPITNNSWGGGAYSATLAALISGNPGHLFVAAAGNDDLDVDVYPEYPGAYPAANILSVASHASTGAKSSFSNYGVGNVDVSAPGSSIASTVPGGYGWNSGTSMAAPHVAGVAAMMLGMDGTLTPADIIDRIEATGRWTHADAVNGVGSGAQVDASRAVAATVTDAPVVAMGAVPATLEIGDPLDITATATDALLADLTASITWYADTDDAVDTVLGSGGSLDHEPTELGRLRIRAEVTDGSSRWTVAVAVLEVVAGLPDPPTGVGGVAGDGSIEVSWSAPADDGGSPVLSYVATASPGGQACAAAATSCTIEGLDNGTDYTVTVVATTAVGESDPSDPSGVVTPAGPPQAPIDVGVEVGPGAATVTWSAPDDGGSPITGYRVTSSPTEVECETASLTCELDGLAGAVAHTITVVAINALGESEAAVLADVVPTIPYVECDDSPGVSSFDDVDPTSYALADIECLLLLGITNGTSDTTFGPSYAVTREQMAAFLARIYRVLTLEECAPDSSSFVDMPVTSYAFTDVECLKELGVTNGTSATTFSPGDVVTREQMAAFLARVYRIVTGEDCAPDTSSFVDMPVTSYAFTDVECLKALGITNGTSATTFSPEQIVTREQMAAFLGRLYRLITIS